ncbi:YaaR family protein, partial [Bacteroidales bacterium MSK.15.36]|nr:YaaR family protein [Bacteroidales bacterium MSK.15.36]
MEISRIGNRTQVSSKEDTKAISSKKSFSQSFNFARERRSEQELKKMFEDIKKKGERLVTTKCYVDVIRYKKMIKEYLESVLNFMYGVKKDISFWQTQYFITVETIDEKLEELTQALLNDQK